MSLFDNKFSAFAPDKASTYRVVCTRKLCYLLTLDFCGITTMAVEEIMINLDVSVTFTFDYPS